MQQLAENIHASLCLHHADITTLLLLCHRIAEKAGVEDLGGLPVIDWFNRERRGQLERQLMAIGDTDQDAVAGWSAISSESAISRSGLHLDRHE